MLFLLNMIHALFHSHVEQKTAKLCHVSETEKKNQLQSHNGSN